MSRPPRTPRPAGDAHLGGRTTPPYVGARRPRTWPATRTSPLLRPRPRGPRLHHLTSDSTRLPLDACVETICRGPIARRLALCVRPFPHHDEVSADTKHADYRVRCSYVKEPGSGR